MTLFVCAGGTALGFAASLSTGRARTDRLFLFHLSRLVGVGKSEVTEGRKALMSCDCSTFAEFGDTGTAKQKAKQEKRHFH